MKKCIRKIFVSLFVICLFSCCLFMLYGCTKKHGNENNENQEVKYSITYDLNGGINNSSNPVEFVKGEEVNLQPATKDGCFFIGWELNGEIVTIISSEITSDITLKAIFEKVIVINKHNIVYDLDEGINDSSNPTEFIEGEVVTLQPATKEGYTFIGWELNGEIVTSISSEVTSDVMLKAIFEVNAVKHKITFDISDSLHLEETEIEYVEGIGLESLPIPTIDNDPNRDEDYQYKFVYWYIDNGDESEVVTYISPDETRDMVLKPMLNYGYRCRESREKYRFDIEDKKVYPFVSILCSTNFPIFDTYALIEIIDRDRIEEITVKKETYYKVYCKIIDVYSELKLDNFKDVECKYFGNYNYDEDTFADEYFIYIPIEIYSLYEDFDTFIVPTKIKIDCIYEDDLASIPTQILITIPSEVNPLSICEYKPTYSTDFKYIGMAINIYPVVDGIIRLNAYNELTESDEEHVSYIEYTYKTFFYDKLSSNPTIEEFSEWFAIAHYRCFQRARYVLKGGQF